MEREELEQYEIIDAHAHIFPDNIARAASDNIGSFYGINMKSSGTSRELIESGSRINVKNYLVCSAATKPQQAASINSFIHSCCEEYPSFIGFGTVHPDSEDIERDIEYLKRLGLKGVKLHPDLQKFDADSKKAFEIYEIIEGQLPLLIHCGDPVSKHSLPERIANIHRNFPKLRMIAAHLGGYRHWEEAEQVLAGLENVKFDISSTFAFMTRKRSRELIEKYGTENCFWGSDFPMWSHYTELSAFFELGFSSQDNKRILSENFKEFLGI